jgi:multidrug efflux pump subunit AcrA (membrane-fusion protein)
LADLDIDHTGCQFHGSGFLPAEKTALLQPKQPVTLKTSRGERLDGFVVAVQKPLAHGEIEIIVGVTTAGTELKDGEFVSATISVPRNEPVIVIPRSALLRTVEGTYVYAVNGDAYYRTAVTVGSSTDDKLEVIDGLYAGDRVVAKPVETLWIIELRATKGGGHSH